MNTAIPLPRSEDLFDAPMERPANIHYSDETIERKPVLLLIDDDRDQLMLFSLMLIKHGYNVVTANGADEAFDILDRTHIDCVVCDVAMPKMNGKDVVESLRRRRRTRYLPVVMLTAANPERQKELLLSGADTFCLKRDAGHMLLAQLELLLF